MSNVFDGLRKGSHFYPPAESFIMPTVLLSITPQYSPTLNHGEFWGINLRHYGDFSSLMRGFLPRRVRHFPQSCSKLAMLASGGERCVSFGSFVIYLLWPLLSLNNNNLRFLASKNEKKVGGGPLLVIVVLDVQQYRLNVSNFVFLFLHLPIFLLHSGKWWILVISVIQSNV